MTLSPEGPALQQ